MKSGVFSVKSAYEFAFEETYRTTAESSSAALDGRRACWKFIWGRFVPPTVKNFAWHVAVNSLPTWQNKFKRALETTGLFPIYEREHEDTFHALCECPLAVQLWDCMESVWRLPKREDLKNSGTEWLLDVLHPLSVIEIGMLLMTLWRVWHNQNEVTHYKEPPPMEASKRFLMGYLESLLSLEYSKEELLKGKQVVAYDQLPRSRVCRRPTPNIKWVLPTEG
ncbi:hypothetical protein D1007_00299 [Hordeum vulgare]|nr:hypothetical protein D1007_00299 [Hordeum vulgare]